MAEQHSRLPGGRRHTHSLISGHECNNVSPVGPKAIVAALYRDTALFRPPCIGITPYSDRLISRYRLIQTSLYRDSALFRPPYIEIPPYSDLLVSGYRLIQTALYGDTALFRPPCIGIPPYSDRLTEVLRYCAWDRNKSLSLLIEASLRTVKHDKAPETKATVYGVSFRGAFFAVARGHSRERPPCSLGS